MIREDLDLAMDMEHWAAATLGYRMLHLVDGLPRGGARMIPVADFQDLLTELRAKRRKTLRTHEAWKKSQHD